MIKKAKAWVAKKYQAILEPPVKKAPKASKRPVRQLPVGPRPWQEPRSVEGLRDPYAGLGNPTAPPRIRPVGFHVQNEAVTKTFNLPYRDAIRRIADHPAWMEDLLREMDDQVWGNAQPPAIDWADERYQRRTRRNYDSAMDQGRQMFLATDLPDWDDEAGWAAFVEAGKAQVLARAMHASDRDSADTGLIPRVR